MEKNIMKNEYVAYTEAKKSLTDAMQKSLIEFDRILFREGCIHELELKVGDIIKCVDNIHAWSTNFNIIKGRLDNNINNDIRLLDWAHQVRIKSARISVQTAKPSNVLFVLMRGSETHYAQVGDEEYIIENRNFIVSRIGEYEGYKALFIEC